MAVPMIELACQQGKIISINRAGARVSDNPNAQGPYTSHREGPRHMMPRESATRAQGVARPTSVYRYYDRSDILIYVGITDRGIRRNREHNEHAVWWPYAVRQEVDHYPDRPTAEHAERALIRMHLPPFNTQHNPEAADCRQMYLDWMVAGHADADPLAVLDSIDRRLPLIPASLGMDDHFALRSLAEHHALASRLQLAEEVLVMSWRRVGKVVRCITHGPRVVLIVKSTPATMPPVDQSLALAPVKFISVKHATFRLGRTITLDPKGRSWAASEQGAP